VPGIVIGAVGVRLALLSRGTSPSVAPAHLGLTGGGPCSSKIGS
jgi:hypothetical protein